MELETVPTSSRDLGSAKQAECEWHDAFYKEHARGDYPETTSEFQERFKRVELTQFCDGGWSWWADCRQEAIGSIGDVRGLRVLDYGCGSGILGVYLSLRGANVRGFDLSGEAIKVANEIAQKYRLSAQFEQMDAEDLKYEENAFDLVVGFGVLHHVIKYPQASDQLQRVMRPQGRAIFVETLWDNPIINLVRKFTTTDEEAGDAHLTEANIEQFGRRFTRVQLQKRHLLYMLKRLANLPERDLLAPVKPRPFWRFIKSTDQYFLNFPLLRRYCGEVIVSLWK